MVLRSVGIRRPAQKKEPAAILMAKGSRYDKTQHMVSANCPSDIAPDAVFAHRPCDRMTLSSMAGNTAGDAEHAPQLHKRARMVSGLRRIARKPQRIDGLALRRLSRQLESGASNRNWSARLKRLFAGRSRTAHGATFSSDARTAGSRRFHGDETSSEKSGPVPASSSESRMHFQSASATECGTQPRVRR
mgnify:CR=1 FL=1